MPLSTIFQLYRGSWKVWHSVPIFYRVYSNGCLLLDSEDQAVATAKGKVTVLSVGTNKYPTLICCWGVKQFLSFIGLRRLNCHLSEAQGDSMSEGAREISPPNTMSRIVCVNAITECTINKRNFDTEVNI